MKSTKHLAIFLPSLRGGGAERSMLRLAQGVAERGYSIDLVLARAEGSYLPEVPDSVRVVDLDRRRVAASLPGLVRYLRRERPEAMLSALDYANIVALWARRLAGGPRRAAVNEQNTVTVNSRYAADWRGRMMPRLVRRFYPWASHIIGNSSGVAADLRQIIGPRRANVDVVYNPVVTEELKQKASQPLDHPWFRPGEPPVILAVGRLVEQKDFPTLLRAFADVRRTRAARLMILGEGPDRDALQKLAAALQLSDDIALPGFVDNPYAYMRRAALYVLSSRWEGLPTVLIEALYCGSPIVATDCPSGPQEILADGRFGQLVPVADERALASAIETALAGAGPQPDAESWRRFEAGVIIDQYVDMLLRD